MAHSPIVGLAMGVFDFCHEGHMDFLRRAAENCDRLVVGVHTDAQVRNYKGIQPSNSGLERKASIEALGFAWQVVVESDRIALCKTFGVDRIFHGDDWDRDTYTKHFGAGLMDELGVELVMLPHTPGISSTALRANVAPVGRWLHSSLSDWNRSHICDHMKGLFSEVGGIWFLSGLGRELAKTHFDGAPRFLLEDGLSNTEAAKLIADHKLKVLVTAHFNFDPIVEVLSEVQDPPSLVVVSHGRSGKPGTSAEVSRNRGECMDDLAGVLWEALLFDTPVILGCSSERKPWVDGLSPTRDELVKVVPAVHPDGLMKAVQYSVGNRVSQQRALGEARLGPIDGQATKQTAQRINGLLSKKQLAALLPG